MKTKKAKKAAIVAMAAVATATVIDMNRAAFDQAMADMRDEYGSGEDAMCEMVYMSNPFDGLIA